MIQKSVGFRSNKLLFKSFFENKIVSNDFLKNGWKFLKRWINPFFTEVSLKIALFSSHNFLLWCTLILQPKSFWDILRISGRFQTRVYPHFVRQNFMPFCEEISSSPRVGVVFINDWKHRLLGPSSASWRKTAVCAHIRHMAENLEWKKVTLIFWGVYSIFFE